MREDKENEIRERGEQVLGLFVCVDGWMGWGEREGEEGNGTKKCKGFDRFAGVFCISLLVAGSLYVCIQTTCTQSKLESERRIKGARREL